MPNYYDKTAINDSEVYDHIFESRGVESVKQFKTKTFKNIKTKNIKVFKYTWSYGDTLHKISLRYYKNSSLWWIIGLVSGKPTDAHFKLGDTVFVPVNPSNIGA